MNTSINEPRIYNKSGELSAYGYSCGYITRETKLTKEMDARLLSKELYMEHGTYHVRQFDNSKNLVWESFYTLSEAKKRYSSINL